MPVSSPTQLGETVSTEKDELSAIKAGLKKVKIFTEYVSARRVKKACREEEGSEGRCSARSEDGEYNYPFDSDSLDDDFEEGESEEAKEESKNIPQTRRQSRMMAGLEKRRIKPIPSLDKSSLQGFYWHVYLLYPSDYSCF